MLCHFLNRGIEPKKVINLPLSEKLFYKACYEVYMEDEYEKYNTVLEKYKDIKMLRWANN